MTRARAIRGNSSNISDIAGLPAVCTYPVEYCEFGSSLTRCKEWLQKTDQALYDHFYSEGTPFSRLVLPFMHLCAARMALRGGGAHLGIGT